MKNAKKAQGLPLRTIVIAALVLMVLVVVLFIFSGRMSWFSETAKSCSSLGGRCETDCGQFAIAAEIPNTDCSSNQKCCKIIAE